MPKAASALTLAFLLLACLHFGPAPARAEEMGSPFEIDYRCLLQAARSQGGLTGSVPGIFYHRPVDLTAPLKLEWLPPSFVDEVSARLDVGPIQTRRATARAAAAVPPATGAWLLAAGLAAFIVSRKRFRDRP
jgi:MprA protease rhombosortase-interaction domain-containing protein